MPMDGSIAGAAGAAGSGLSATTASVVNNNAATEAAFCNAEACYFRWVNDSCFKHVLPIRQLLH